MKMSTPLLQGSFAFYVQFLHGKYTLSLLKRFFVSYSKTFHKRLFLLNIYMLILLQTYVKIFLLIGLYKAISDFFGYCN